MSKRSEPAEPSLESVANSCLAMHVRLAARALTALYDEALRPYSLKASQMNVLVALSQLQPVSPAELGRRLLLEKSAVSRTLDRLAAQGWLQVRRADSGRGLRCELTAIGRRRLAKVLPAWGEAQTAASNLLGAEGARALRDIARSVTPEPRGPDANG